MDDRASGVARDVKEPGQGEAAGLGRCHGFHVQRSGSLAWTWADGPAATRSICGVPASSGGAIASSRVTSPPSPSDLGRSGRWRASGRRGRGSTGRAWPDGPVVLPVVLHRDAARVQVHDGAALGLVQAEDGEPDAVHLGQFGRRGGPAAGRGRHLWFPAMGQHAQPSFRQAGGGRDGDAVAGDAQAGAQPGELARGRARRGHAPAACSAATM